MKCLKQALVASTVFVSTAVGTVAMAAEDTAITGAISSGITDAGDTAKAVYVLVIGAFILILAASWALSAVKSNKK